MKTPTSYILTLLLALTISTQQTPLHPHPNQQPLSLPLPAPSTPTLRPIHPADLPSLTNLIIDAFRPSATWHYLIPNFAAHEPEFRACMVRQVEREWANRHRNATFGNVITVPADEASGSGARTEGGEEIVAVALWNIRDETNHHIHTHPLLVLLSTTSPASCPDINTTRALSLAAQQSSLEQRYLSPLAPRQLYLHTLATHPSWDGHGFAARHCIWGQHLAGEMGVPVTLTATEAGWPVYDALGWRGLRRETLRGLEGERVGEWVEAMVWEGEGE